MKGLYTLTNLIRLVKSFRPKSLLPYIGVIILFVAVWKVNAEQPLYQFSGIYKPSEVLPAFCTDCALELPPEYVETQMVLSVRTDSKTDLFKALQGASLANGWKLTKKGKKVKAVREEDKGRLFISCLDSSVHRVSSDEYALRLKSDSIKCAARAKQDSIRRIPPLPPAALPEPYFQRYRLEYIAFNKAFSDKMGVEWKEVLAKGNLKSRPSFYDSWQLRALETSDTNFSMRSVEFALDTSVTIDWGSEKQVPEKTYSQDGGVVTTSYEWRKYGISVKVKKDERRIDLEYMVRNDDNGTLNGNAAGAAYDSLALNGNYRYSQETSEGIPFFSRIPLIGYLFSVKNVNTDYKHFEIYLYPVYKETEE